MSALIRYSWPGNIRELQNVIERAAILAAGPVLIVRGEDLRPPDEAPASPLEAATDSVPAGGGSNIGEALEKAERERILAALQDSNWVISGPAGAAARLGLKRSTMQSRMRKFGIRISRAGT
jgi:transcriptional regulator with GAF, ATPase, and Fis domain